MYNSNVDDMNKLIKDIFDLQQEVSRKCMKITMLEFEIEIQKKLLDMLYTHKLNQFLGKEEVS